MCSTAQFKLYRIVVTTSSSASRVVCSWVQASCAAVDVQNYTGLLNAYANTRADFADICTHACTLCYKYLLQALVMKATVKKTMSQRSTPAGITTAHAAGRAAFWLAGA
jgi:hypothetical protein